MEIAYVAIVGGGLSGLYAAFLLEQKGIKDYILLEARDVLGGRIVSVPSTENQISGNKSTADRFDLGAAWFWPNLQPQVDRLIRNFALERFEQFASGDMVVERSLQIPPKRISGYTKSPTSMRLVGGMSALIDTLYCKLDETRIITGQKVRRLRIVDQHIEIESEDLSSQVKTWRAMHVLLALPPRLVEASIEFSPTLPPVITKQWRSTATWMAPHAKYIAIYDTPFWREQDLSGEAHSKIGPLGEIHDASMPGGSAALFGFFDMPARIRQSLSEDELRSQCCAQIIRLFGPQADVPTKEVIKDWAQDPNTATLDDLDSSDHDSLAPVAAVSSGPWKGHLTGIASEWSPYFSGYVAGAIEAATLGIQALLESTR